MLLIFLIIVIAHITPIRAMRTIWRIVKDTYHTLAQF